MNKGTFLIVDGSSLIHRAFFALPILSNAKGEYTNAVYGLATMLNKVLATEQPEKVVVCFDKSRVTFRTALYADYKGQRGETPDELRPQFELAKQMLDAMGIVWEEIQDYEADDIIGTLARLGSQQGNVLVLTGDKDSFQLINPSTKVMLTKKGITNTEIWDEAALQERYQLTPERMIDLKALMGDTSDNIPGIHGVGEKTALKLLAEYGTVENVLANAEQISGKALRQKVLDGKEQAMLSKTLATIDCHMEEKVEGLADLSKYQYQPKAVQDNPALVEFYQQMGFTTLLKATVKPDISVAVKPQGTASNPTLQQLFDTVEIPVYQELQNGDALAEVCRGKEALALYLHQDTMAVALPDNSVFVMPLSLLIATPGTASVVLADEQVKKITCQGKEMLVKLASKGIVVNGVVDDLALAAYLLDPVAANYAPYTLAQQYLNQTKVNVKDYTQQEIAALAAGQMFPLQQILADKLAAGGLEKLYTDLELPLMFVLAEMERTGITVDSRVLEKMNLELAAKEAALTTEIYDLAGRSFNINSPKQLGEVLFNELGIPPVKKTKTGYSTDVEVLEQLGAEYEIASKVLEFRSYAKLRSTYAQGLQALIQPDGKIHTCFNQTVTATGRLSSTDPNLQNIPVREELGRKLRAAFLASPGCQLVAADYSQIELRVLAHISDDKVFQQSFIANEDIHSRTAAEVFEVPITEVTREQRRRAKAVNFGIVYGISDYGLSRDLKIPRQESKEYIEKYLQRYDGVRFYMKDIVEQGKAKGYVETLLGRKRWLPDLKSKNYNLRSFAERTALNTPIQGTAADIIKIAMLRIAGRLRQEQLQTKMLLQVHDELIFDVPEAELDVVKPIIKEEMEHAYAMKVPTTVDMKVGTDWYHMEKVDVE